MAFNSLTYFLFLPLVWLAYQWTPDRLRWLVLLLASLGFYAALRAPYLPAVLGVVAAVTFAVGLRLGRCDDEAGRKRLLWIGVGANLLVLVALKYLPAFFSGFHFSPFAFDISALVTIGVSYYVFQAIAYLADIYLEIIEPEPHFGYLFLSLAFFPKLLQGPIERSGDLLPQLKRPYEFDYENMRAGMLLFVWGLFKKVVVADRLALFVNAVYGDVHAYTGLPLLLATWFYAFQIYFDFSGYTDMALGTARMFNIELTRNFNAPYLATSVADFWRRWHISFSRWILDYIFKPLQMGWRDLGKAGTAAALAVTFLVSGVWHGASWGFVVWGALHGLYLACSVYYKPWQKRLHKALGVEKTKLLKVWQTVVTFNLVCFAWIFFRANSLGDAMYVVRHLFVGIAEFAANIVQNVSSLNAGKGIFEPILMGQSRQEFLISIAVISILALLETKKHTSSILDQLPVLLRWPLYYGFLLLILFFGVFSNNHQFVYFKF